MKTIKNILVLLLGLLPFLAGAQGSAYKISDKAALERNFNKTLWFNSNNAAGLSISPLARCNELAVGYDMSRGDYKLKQQALKGNNIFFNTYGALMIDGYALWGKFSFENFIDRGASFNTTLFDPLADDMPYYVADTTSSGWAKQSYNLQMKVATPIFWDLMSVGVDLLYSNNLSAKQNDPRSESYLYFITVKPSLVFKFNKHSIGVNGYYRNWFERSTHTNSNALKQQMVFMLRGLGNSITDVVGTGDGVGIVYYKSNRYGGGLQYSYSGDVELLFDAAVELQKLNAYNTPTKPEILGSTSQMDINAKFQILFGGNKSNNITLDVRHRATDGIEHVKKWNTEGGKWDIISSDIRSNYLLQTAKLSYDKFLGQLPSYKWRFGGMAMFTNKADEYLIPNSKFSYTNIYAQLYGKKNFTIKQSNILLGLRGGYNYNLAGEYVFRGSEANKKSRVVTEWYANDIAVYTSNFIKLGLDLDYSIEVSKKIALRIGGNFDYILPDIDNRSRCLANISFGMIF